MTSPAVAVAARDQDVVGVQIVGVGDPRRLVIEALLESQWRCLSVHRPPGPGK